MEYHYLKQDRDLTVTNIDEPGPILNYRSFLNGLIYNWVTPVNFTLSLFIVIHNSIIVRSYYLERTGIVQLIFLWIGIADIFAAIGVMVFTISSTLYYNGVVDPLPFQNGVIFFLLVTPVALACSRSLNVFVTMIKTINITSIARRGIPVHTNNIALFIVCFATFILWLAANTFGVIIDWMAYYEEGDAFAHILINMLGYSSLLGLCILEYIVYWFDLSSVPDCNRFEIVFVITFHYILPPIITFITMVIQAFFIKSSIQQDSISNQPSAFYINMTIFMVTALFCCCHTALCIYMLHAYSMADNIFNVYPNYTWSFFEYTPLLVNAALFPVIIILRKQSLRDKYRDCFLGMFSSVRRGVGAVVGRCGVLITWVCGVQRRLDYEEI